MPTEHDDVELEGTVEARSAKAVLFQADFWDKAEWLPLSQCEVVPDPSEEGKVTIYIRRWLARKNGWE